MSKIIVTGGSGFLGTHLCKQLSSDYNQVFSPSSKKFNLIDRDKCDELMSYAGKPDIVIHLAAKCGGIGANMKSPGSYFYQNMMMGMNVIEACRKAKVSKVVLIGTVCSYPKHCAVPFLESDIWKGYPEETNAPYGIAKKALYVMLDAYKKEYGLNSTIIVPTNLYGPHDNFDDSSSHVIPALIKKIYYAKINKEPSVEVWGDGSASREFLYVEDAAKAIGKAAYTRTDTRPMNIGSGKEISIKELAHKIKILMDYDGDLIFNHNLPNGQPRRCLNTSLAYFSLNWKAETSLDLGLRNTIDWFVSTVK
jgi:GDP-L-fucose synthase